MITVLPKRVEILKRFSSVSFFIYFLIIATVAIQSFSYNKFNIENKKEAELNLYNFDFHETLGSLGMAIFSYNCIGSFFMVSNSLVNPTKK